MKPTRLTFILSEALGWKIYKSRIFAVAESRDDIVAQFIKVPTQGWRKPFLKNDYATRPFERLLRRFDPINAYRGRLGAEIRREIRNFGPSALYIGGHWLAGSLEGMEPRIPFAVVTDHTRSGIPGRKSPGIWSRAEMEREARLYRSADHVFAMSDWSGKSLLGDCQVDPARVTVMPASLDLTNFVRPAYEDHGVLRLIFIGNDFLRKGGDKLCRWVAGPLAGKVELHVASGDPEATKQRPGVISYGRVPNERLLRELLPTMDALCLPTTSDMSSLAVIEAAAAGLPVVASAIGGIPELVIEGETGFLLAPDDEAGFVAALERLAADRELRRRLGMRAWDLARRKHDANLNYNALIDQLIQLGSRNGATG